MARRIPGLFGCCLIGLASLVGSMPAGAFMEVEPGPWASIAAEFVTEPEITGYYWLPSLGNSGDGIRFHRFAILELNPSPGDAGGNGAGPPDNWTMVQARRINALVWEAFVRDAILRSSTLDIFEGRPLGVSQSSSDGAAEPIIGPGNASLGFGASRWLGFDRNDQDLFGPSAFIGMPTAIPTTSPSQQ